MPVEVIAVYFAIISLIAVVVTVHDKRVSKLKGRRRVPEASLLTIASLGGSVAMYVTMNLIRHKTRHPKFTVGIPVIIVLQAAAIVLLHVYVF